MRGLLTVGLIALVPLAAAAQWHGTPGRTAPMRPPMAVKAVPMAHPFMVRPAPMPVRGFWPNRPGRIMPSRLRGRPGFRSRHVGFGFGFGLGNYPFGVPPQNRCFSDAFFDPFFCTRRPVPFRSFGSFASFGAYPFYSYPLITDYSSDDYSDAAAQQMARQTAQASAQASDLTAQIEQLREELLQLRQQQSSPAAAAPASVPEQTAKAEEPPAPTTLVFRDGRRSEVENYAIVGNTLWVFSDQRRKKIPIAELDLKATQQANADQGVDFVLPSSGK